MQSQALSLKVDQLCEECSNVLQHLPHIVEEDAEIYDDNDVQAPRVQWCTTKVKLRFASTSGCRFCTELLLWIQTYEDENEENDRENQILEDQWRADEKSRMIPGEEPPAYLLSHLEAEENRSEFDLRAFRDLEDIHLSVCKLDPVSAQTENIPRIEIRIFHNNTWIQFFWLYIAADAGEFNISLQLSTHKRVGDLAAHYIKSRPIDHDPLSPQNISLARAWLKECMESHSNCFKPPCSTLPKRVIDVGLLNSHTPAKLHISTGETGDYVALSYCWGGPQAYSLTSQTIDALTRCLDTSSLPRTLQDAILITQELNQRYLWVDALCIIQDSPEDKQENIGTMHDIYHNAVVTICASSAKNCNEGFLQNRSSLFPAPIIIPYACPNGQVGSVRLRPQLELEAKDEPLEQRGWTFQERCLSPRIIAYRSVIWWQCSVSHHGPENCEDVSTPFWWKPQSSGFHDVTDSSGQASSAGRGVSDQPSHPVDFETEWNLAVETYTTRQLTDPADKLSALAGLAADFAHRSQGTLTYLAGLWRHSLLNGLLFIVDYHDGNREERPQIYRAPSWSWASVDGRIKPSWHQSSGKAGTDPTTLTPLLTVLDCKTILSSARAIYGQVNDGTLTVQGYLQRVRHLGQLGWSECFVDSSASSLPSDADFPQHIEGYLDTATDINRLRDGRQMPELTYDHNHLRSTTQSVRGAELWALPVLTGERFVYGLLLDENPDSTFRRLGYFEARDPPQAHQCKWATKLRQAVLVIK